jgi:hypothetical protein
MFEIAATTIAASGPYRTAVNNVGTSEMETSVVTVKRMLPRSAYAAIKPSATTVQ